MTKILSISKLSERVAKAFLKQRIELGFPLLNGDSKQGQIVEAYREKYLAPPVDGAKKKHLI
jgi:hypothetical protein